MTLVNIYAIINQLPLDNDVRHEIKSYFIKKYLYDVMILVQAYNGFKRSSIVTNFLDIEDIIKNYTYTSITVVIAINSDVDNKNYIINIMKNKWDATLNNKNIIIRYNKDIIQLAITTNNYKYFKLNLNQ